ncbi:MAG TPA: galactokinase family protein [Acidimicrobiia bacterium]|nr:galactokinase family protein [Acidimicrobiia bacterium]
MSSRIETEAETAFRSRFGRAPDVVVSAPGRVNLIGEHTDYSLLPVMPFAIDRRLTLACAAIDSWEIHSTFEETSLTGIPGEVGWHRYVTAAVRHTGYAGGVAGIVTSDLPATGGLASSSALMMALIAALYGLEGRLDPTAACVAEIVRTAASAERQVGVESGAMDQTVIAYGRKANALRIDFALDGSPRVTNVPWPPDLQVVVAYSGEPAHKGAGAQFAYNRSVVSCRVAAALLARAAGLSVPAPLVLGRVADVDGVQDLAARLPIATTARVVARDLGVDIGSLVRLTATGFDPDVPLPVRASAVHVLAEAGRVDAAQDALTAGDSCALGELLDASHASLGAFGASTPRLDALTAAMREAGASGSRLTGAGFGGNALALCDPGRADRIVAAALAATGGPAYAVAPDDGLHIVS